MSDFGEAALEAPPKTGAIDLRVGRWQDVLAGFGGEPEPCNTLISDPPYGARTHDQEEGKRYDGYSAAGMRPDYKAWTPTEIDEFVDAWHPAVSGWMCTMTSHELVPAWEAAYRRVDRYCFAPVPCVIRAMSVRRSADGPSSWCVWLIVARPRTRAMATWGTLPGAYVGNRVPGSKGGRGKPLWLMTEIVRDYSRPGDLVVDPLCGWGSTNLAASALGRPSIGADVDPDAIAKAHALIRQGVQPELIA